MRVKRLIRVFFTLILCGGLILGVTTSQASATSNSANYPDFPDAHVQSTLTQTCTEEALNQQD